MTSKERVHRALERQSTDRVPIFMWYHPQTTRRLGNLLEIPAKYVPLAMGDDIRQAWVSNNYPMEGIKKLPKRWVKQSQNRRLALVLSAFALIETVISFTVGQGLLLKQQEKAD